MSNETYDPKGIMATVGPVLVNGWAPDAMVNVDFQGERFIAIIGADGEVIWQKTHNSIAKFEFTLMPNSAANVALSALHGTDLASSKGLVPVAVSVPSVGKTFSGLGRITKTPGQNFQAEPQPTTWEVTVAPCVFVQVLSPGPLA